MTQTLRQGTREQVWHYQKVQRGGCGGSLPRESEAEPSWLYNVMYSPRWLKYIRIPCGSWLLLLKRPCKPVPACLFHVATPGTRADLCCSRRRRRQMGQR
ncbi:hypothetical protein FKM82_024740 [Ascaphus truei]